MKENLFSYLDLCISEDQLSHAFLIETNNPNQLFEELTSYLLSRQMIKNSVLENNINIIGIAPDGKEIKSAAISRLQERFSIRPAHDEYNIYIISEAEKMNTSAANKLLKFLEEPNNQILGFLITTADSPIISTIKSRCQVFKNIYGEPDTQANPALKLLLDLLQNYSYESSLDLKKAYAIMERGDLITIFQNAISFCESEISLDTNKNELMIANILLFDKILHLLKSNVNIELVLDKLCIELR